MMRLCCFLMCGVCLCLLGLQVEAAKAQEAPREELPVALPPVSYDLVVDPQQEAKVQLKRADGEVLATSDVARPNLWIEVRIGATVVTMPVVRASPLYDLYNRNRGGDLAPVLDAFRAMGPPVIRVVAVSASHYSEIWKGRKTVYTRCWPTLRLFYDVGMPNGAAKPVSVATPYTEGHLYDMAFKRAVDPRLGSIFLVAQLSGDPCNRIVDPCPMPQTLGCGCRKIAPAEQRPLPNAPQPGAPQPGAPQPPAPQPGAPQPAAPQPPAAQPPAERPAVPQPEDPFGN